MDEKEWSETEFSLRIAKADLSVARKTFNWRRKRLVELGNEFKKAQKAKLIDKQLYLHGMRKDIDEMNALLADAEMQLNSKLFYVKSLKAKLKEIESA